MKHNNDIFIPDKESAKKVLQVEIDCVTPPTDEQKEKIRSYMLEQYKVDEVNFVIKIDPSVVGGFRIFAGDDNYDWTTLGRIRQLRKSFQSLIKEKEPDKIISLLREDISSFDLDAGQLFKGRHHIHAVVGTVGDILAPVVDVQGDILALEAGPVVVIRDGNVLRDLDLSRGQSRQRHGQRQHSCQQKNDETLHLISPPLSARWSRR